MKKIVLIIATLFTFTIYGNTLPGDLNMDNAVNATDALFILKHAAKITEISDNNILISADVNSDSSIDASDALLVLKYAAHIIESFPPTEIPATAEPVITAIPEFNSENVFDITVKNLNDVATQEGAELTFIAKQRHDDGVEMNNPFSLYEITDGVSISFRYTPADDITDKYANTTILAFAHEEKAQIIKFDMEGSYQYADGKSFINSWDPDYEFKGGVTYFMTCVISGNGLRYYVNGSPIPILNQSMISTSAGKEKILPLIMDTDTRLYIGGTDNLWWNEMASLAAHDLPIGTKVKDVKAYFKPMTTQEVMELYRAQLN